MTLGFIILILLCLLATWYEKKTYKTMMAPTTIMVWPFVIVIFLALFMGPLFGFKRINENEIWIIILGIFSFFVGEILWNIVLRKKTRNFKINRVQYSDRFLRIANNYLEYVVIILALRYVIIFRSIGFSTYFATDGGNEIMTKGIYIHLMLSLFPLIPVLFDKGMFDKNKKTLLFVGIFIVEVFLTYTKYHVIMLLIATMFYIITFRPKALPFVCTALVVIPIMAFSLNYFLNFRANGNILSSKYLAGHLMNYLIGGVSYSSVSNSWLHNLDFWNLVGSFVMPFPNLFIRMILGFSVCPPIEIPFITLSSFGERGNVVNFITLVLGGSKIGGVIFFLILGMIASGIIGRKKENSMLKVYFLAVIFLSFFSAYLGLIVPWEVFFWCVVINFISKHKVKFGDRIKI